MFQSLEWNQDKVPVGGHKEVNSDKVDGGFYVLLASIETPE